MKSLNMTTWAPLLFVGLLNPSIPFGNIIIGVFALHAIIFKCNKNGLNSLRQQKNLLYILLPFFVFLVSALYSANLLQGWIMLEKKLALIIFPIFFSLYKTTWSDLIIIFKRIVVLFTLSVLIGFCYQFVLYYNGLGNSGLFYNDLLFSYLNKQAVYFSWYVNVFILLVYWLKLKDKLSNKWTILLLLLCVIVNYLMASRISLVLTFSFIPGIIGHQMMKGYNKRKGWILIAICVMSFIGFLFFFPQTLNRVKSISNSEVNFDNTNPINHFNGEIKEENWNGLNIRKAIWICSIDALREKPVFGYGIGNVETALQQSYTKRAFKFGLSNNFNTHSQYFDISLSAGLFGLLIILFSWIMLIVKGVKSNNKLLVLFILISLLVMLTENVLNRNQGVYFYAFFISLLALVDNQEKHTKIL